VAELEKRAVVAAAQAEAECKEAIATAALAISRRLAAAAKVEHSGAGSSRRKHPPAAAAPPSSGRQQLIGHTHHHTSSKQSRQRTASGGRRLPTLASSSDSSGGEEIDTDDKDDQAYHHHQRRALAAAPPTATTKSTSSRLSLMKGFHRHGAPASLPSVTPRITPRQPASASASARGEPTAAAAQLLSARRLEESFERALVEACEHSMALQKRSSAGALAGGGRSMMPIMQAASTATTGSEFDRGEVIEGRVSSRSVVSPRRGGGGSGGNVKGRTKQWVRTSLEWKTTAVEADVCDGGGRRRRVGGGDAPISGSSDDSDA